MSDDEVTIGFILASFVLASLFGGCAFGDHVAAQHWRTEAVKRGAAEWITDAAGNVSFKWKGGDQ